MCGYGPCSPTYCPSGSTSGSRSGCWYEFTNPRSPVSVNRGELKVTLKAKKAMNTPGKTFAPMYRFAFIKDPQERTMGHKQGRVGAWKLQVSPNEEKTNSRQLHLSWKLRDPKPNLQKNETLRLAVTWMGAKKRQYRVLPGTYNARKHQVSAQLPAHVLRNSQVYLLPVKHIPSTAMSHAPAKPKPRLSGLKTSMLVAKP